MVTPRLEESSATIPVGKSTLRPMAKLPNAKAVMENCLRNTVFPQLDGTQLQAAQTNFG
jgi:hypothetical protein